MASLSQPVVSAASLKGLSGTATPASDVQAGGGGRGDNIRLGLGGGGVADRRWGGCARPTAAPGGRSTGRHCAASHGAGPTAPALLSTRPAGQGSCPLRSSS